MENYFVERAGIRFEVKPQGDGEFHVRRSDLGGKSFYSGNLTDSKAGQDLEFILDYQVKRFTQPPKRPGTKFTIQL